jgi:hypothetical protein
MKKIEAVKVAVNALRQYATALGCGCQEANGSSPSCRTGCIATKRKERLREAARILGKMAK